MQKTSLVLLIFLLAINCYSQSGTSSEHPEKVIHGSIGTLVFYYTCQLNYDRLLKQKDTGFFKAYYANLKSGVMVGGSLNGSSSYGYWTGIGYRIDWR